MTHQIPLFSDVIFVAPKTIKGFDCFGTITPQGTEVEEAAPPVYWGTFAAGIYRIDYVGGARRESFDPTCWFLDFAIGSSSNYELFYSGGEQDQRYPAGTLGCYPSAAALEAANAGASFVFTHTGGKSEWRLISWPSPILGFYFLISASADSTKGYSLMPTLSAINS